jgi:hypothetical protein
MVCQEHREEGIAVSKNYQTRGAKASTQADAVVSRHAAGVECHR